MRNAYPDATWHNYIFESVMLFDNLSDKTYRRQMDKVCIHNEFQREAVY